MAEFTYVDLIEWSRQLPEWQRDALRRILVKGNLASGDVADLVELAKASYDTGNGSSAKAVPASLDHVRLSVEALPAVRIVAVRNIARVNALAEGPVPFGDAGLTIVYGGNATGKSGVVRILKKACRARDPGGPIFPNVFEPEPSEPATATIDYRVGEEQRSTTWVERGVSDPDLSTVNVFDARCAAVQVEEPNLISYTPAILQVFRTLAEVIDQVANRLRNEKLVLGVRPSALNELGLGGDTEAGKFLSSLSAESDPEDLQKLCEINEEERARLYELQRALADDPVRKAETEEARGRRVGELDMLAADAVRQLSDAACDGFSILLSKREATRQAAEAAREAFAASSLLDGLGTEVWRALWESARRYSETHAYSGEPFPVVRKGALCVLCQQPLSTEASVRLHSFEEFVQTDVQQRATEVKTEVTSTVAAIRSLSLPHSVRVSLRDAGLIRSQEGEALRRFLVGAKLRQRYVMRAADGKPVGGRPTFPQQPDLRTLREAIQDEVGRLRSASRAEERLGMERERAELQARQKLAQHFETVRSEIERLQSIRNLDAAITECKTHSITLKARQAATLIITDRLRSGFDTNLSAIGFSETPVEMKLGAGEYGKHPYEMKLIPRPEVPPGEVLSEGERTSVALAGFLAEIETAGNCSAIVLDDPVSSLDHRYRKRVAELLVREAKKRQVILLTHDFVFLYLLRKYTDELSVSLTEVSLERGYKGGHGRATEGPPWIAMPVNRRIGKLRDDLASARRVLKEGDRGAYEQKASDIYRRLRQSWERAVEEVLLYETVVRFGDAVQTKRLSKLTDISDSDAELVTREMSRCSDFLHDEAGAVYGDVPDPDVVEADINRLSDWLKDLRKNRGRG